MWWTQLNRISRTYVALREPQMVDLCIESSHQDANTRSMKTRKDYFKILETAVLGFLIRAVAQTSILL